jgi:hypothetical protein
VKVDELLDQGSAFRDKIIARIKAAKSPEEKQKWAAYLVKNRFSVYEETMKEYHDRLVSTLNIKKLGSGAYAHVFQHPTYHNVVVKVFTDRDTTYKKYVNWCLKNQGNKYVPQIIEMVPVKSPSGDKYNIVFMEKMNPVSGPSFHHWLETKFGTAVMSAYADSDYDQMFIEFGKAVQAGTDSDLKKIWAHIKTYGADHFDLAAGNVMSKGLQIVFTDPVGAAPDGERVDEH